MSATGRRVSKFSGYALAIPTPFDDAGTVASVKRANDKGQVNAAVSAVVPR